MKKIKILTILISSLFITNYSFANNAITSNSDIKKEISAQNYIEPIITNIFNDVKNQKNKDIVYINYIVENKIINNVDMDRLTQFILGKHNRNINEQQKEIVKNEFKKLLIKTYANAFLEINEQQLNFKPFRGNLNDSVAVVKSKITGRGEPVDLDFKLEKQEDKSWKIIDLNILGIWLAQSYKSQFEQVISASGIDGLIKTLKDKNK